MKILLDECLPVDLRHSFSVHETHTAEWVGLKGRKNGELLDAAESAGYDALLTMDQGFEHQQNLAGRGPGRIGPAGRAPCAAAKFGVEGFSESLFKEIGPLWIKVTIIEPGGFRTDFAGSSTQLSEGRSEYDSTVGAAVRFQRSYNGRQPGEPAKAAAALLHVASLSEPPLRLLLGSDSYAAAEKSALDKIESDRNWKDLSLSTDYASDETYI